VVPMLRCDRAVAAVPTGGERKGVAYGTPDVLETAVFGVPHESLGEEEAVAAIHAGRCGRPGRAPGVDPGPDGRRGRRSLR
jgi:hypothetical protein